MSIGMNPPTLNAATEKPLHYSYLKEFRVDACPLFKQHQCQQHRPYTCFYWHFANQRRRRPIRKRDGTFNYSPDIYCAKYDENTGMCPDGDEFCVKYDENTGICPDGDECPFLHRVAGDVERKYHLRYYKTANCVHQTDAKGHCTKNGQHCAFAHSPDDLRQPVYDIRELQTAQDQPNMGGTGGSGAPGTTPTSAQLYTAETKERTSFVVEDPVWQEQEHVLSCYKTSQCRKPPRLCRQGYACPYYHNAKDRRRPPAVHKYRSTPCPNAKMADEWTDPDNCEHADNCQYCHSRTEQQFHPEIYKSTKCNDMLQHGYCPRGPFCAFAHNDAELHAERNLHVPPLETTPTGPQPGVGGVTQQQAQARQLIGTANTNGVDIPEAPRPPSESIRRSGSSEAAGLPAPVVGSAPSYSSVLKQRTPSQSSTHSTSSTNNTTRPLPHGPGPAITMPQTNAAAAAALLSSSYPRAPGFERGHQSPPRTFTPEFGDRSTNTGRTRATSLSHQFERLDLGCTLTSSNEQLGTSPLSTSGFHGRTGSLSGRRASDNPYDSVFGQTSLGNLLEDTTSSGDECLPLPPITERDESGNNHAAVHNYAAFGLNQAAQAQQQQQRSAAVPMTIPGAQPTSTGFHTSVNGCQPQFSMSASGSFGSGESPFSQAQLAAMVAAAGIAHVNANGADTTMVDQTALLAAELARAKEELQSHRGKVTSWEEGLKQARQACEAWKREAEAHKARVLVVDAERTKYKDERDAALAQLAALRAELLRIQQQKTAPATLTAAALANGTADTRMLESIMAQLQQQQRQQQQPTSGTGPMCGRCGRVVSANANGVCTFCNGSATQLKGITSST